MFKFVSAVLLVGLLVLAAFFGIEKCNSNNLRKQLNNTQVELEGVLKETETAFSIRAKLEEDLSAKSKELHQIIKDRDERILAQTNLNIQLKDKLLKLQNAQQSVIDQEDKVVIITEPNKCDEFLRYRVDFDVEESPLKITGFTLTNPPYAELNIRWLNPLNLELNLTKDSNGNFRVYADSHSTEWKIGDISLNLDPSVLELRWYQRISFGADLSAGEYGGMFVLRPGYDVLNNLNVNLLFVVLYDGSRAKLFYGAGITWSPWKN